MSKRLEELKAERADISAKLFLVRCALTLLTLLFIVVFVFEKPITLPLMAFSMVMAPLALFCYDKLASKLKDGRK